jgi:hypothetical protein
VRHHARVSNAEVVYIAGYGRSGSTLLDLLLGRLDGWFSMGEFRLFWHALRDGWRCGCGKDVCDCHVWSDVLARAHPIDVERVLADFRESVRLRRVPGYSDPRLLGSHRRAHDDLARTLGRVYEAAAAATGARVLVDSSKDPIYGLLLAEVLGARMHVVHLVRDSRAVAWSWQRTRVRPEVTTRDDALMPVRPAWKTSLDWDLRNALSHLLGSRARGYTRVTYEHLASNPETALAAIVRAARGSSIGDTDSTLHTLSTDSTNHTVGGNPIRFDPPLRVAPDVEWQSALARRDRSLVTTLTWPLLRTYGYS